MMKQIQIDTLNVLCGIWWVLYVDEMLVHVTWSKPRLSVLHATMNIHDLANGPIFCLKGHLILNPTNILIQALSHLYKDLRFLLDQLGTFPHCSVWVIGYIDNRPTIQFNAEIMSQKYVIYRQSSVFLNSQIMHCGIFFNIHVSYWI